MKKSKAYRYLPVPRHVRDGEPYNRRSHLISGTVALFVRLVRHYHILVKEPPQVFFKKNSTIPITELIKFLLMPL